MRLPPHVLAVRRALEPGGDVGYDGRPISLDALAEQVAGRLRSDGWHLVSDVTITDRGTADPFHGTSRTCEFVIDGELFREVVTMSEVVGARDPRLRDYIDQKFRYVVGDAVAQRIVPREP